MYLRSSSPITRCICFGAVLTIWSSLHVSFAAQPCNIKADVPPEYCRFFAYYEDQQRTLDERIGGRINARTNSDSHSIALIVGISSYPHIADPLLSSIDAARIDVGHLKAFLKDDQQFDEIIVLENADATAANIHYFLDSYMPRRSTIFQGRARVLFAYSGHGVPASGGLPASLVLANARSFSDSDNLYALSLIRTSIENLAPSSFHVLALINACYGGAVFGLGQIGGNPSVSNERGSYALTAGPADKVVASLGGPTDGSIFFDDLIRGIKTGDADRDYPIYVGGTGAIVQRGGVVRLGSLNTYITTQIEALGPLPSANGPVKLKAPWIGPVEPQGTIAAGAFFFLSPAKSDVPGHMEIKLGAGPKSSVPGQPEIKYFGGFEEYPVRGIDVSHAEGNIDWNRVEHAGIKFAYIRAASSVGIDLRFASNWSDAGRHHLDRGAYLVYSYCQPVDDQIKKFASIVPHDQANLPVTIDVESYDVEANWSVDEIACAKSASDSVRRARVFELAEKLRVLSEKTPIIYANRRVLARLNDNEKFNNYMIWLASYGSSKEPASTKLQLPGRNPWTLWQFTASATIAGIGRNVDSDVFFGTRAQYQAFRHGSGNVALQVATRLTASNSH